jgi:serine protease AprX
VFHSATSRRRTGAIAALLAVALPLTATEAANAAPNAAARLTAAAKQTPNQKVTALVQFKPDVSEKQARTLLKGQDGAVTDELGAIKGFAVKLTAGKAAALRNSKLVANVTLNTKIQPASVGDPSLATSFPLSVGAEQAWAQGITGKGVGVAVIDSGISGDIADFKNADGSSRVTNVIANPGASTPNDVVGHGTHVAGIVAGNSKNRTDANQGRYQGIAPDADLVAIKTSDDNGESTVLDVINALQFVVDHKDELNIKVVNLSVSSDTPSSYEDDPLDAAVEFAWHAGIVVVSAAGNRGDVADATQYAPGNDPFVISVGATDEANTANPADDAIASFSSRGVTQDGFAKPEVFAPGAKITAPLAGGSAFAALAPVTSIFGGGQYVRIGGTSMASPVVAGAAALLLQARPDLTPDQVKALLTQNVNLTGDRRGELSIPKALAAQAGTPANQGVQPAPAVYEAMVAGGIDPTRATWTRATWTDATWTRATWTRATWTRATWTGGISAPWARATWTCEDCATEADAAGVDATRSTWTRSTWTRSTWTSVVDW